MTGGAFGEHLPQSDPDGDGQAFTLNLRFPGQYYDEESGLHYNYFRDYDPNTGRYIQSDPIGLAGGINTYAYVEGNPLSSSDPSGLAASYCVRNPTALGCGPLEGGFGGGMSRGGTATAGPDPVGFCLKLIGSVIGALAGSDACSGGGGGGSQGDCSDCSGIQAEINELIDELETRLRHLREDRNHLYENRPTGSFSWAGHRRKYKEVQDKLREKIGEAQAKGCPYNSRANQLANQSPPSRPSRY
ncbi:MAG: RHS repeat-associated core domain-containing protein [Candidatus Contendobacter sp.]|nr:RHS repeat-associated core domain-containing protein [Candidatus Contendobacter sp.]